MASQKVVNLEELEAEKGKIAEKAVDMVTA